MSFINQMSEYYQNQYLEKVPSESEIGSPTFTRIKTKARISLLAKTDNNEKIVALSVKELMDREFADDLDKEMLNYKKKRHKFIKKECNLIQDRPIEARGASLDGLLKRKKKQEERNILLMNTKHPPHLSKKSKKQILNEVKSVKEDIISKRSDDSSSRYSNPLLSTNFTHAHQSDSTIDAISLHILPSIKQVPRLDLHKRISDIKINKQGTWVVTKENNLVRKLPLLPLINQESTERKNPDKRGNVSDNYILEMNKEVWTSSYSTVIDGNKNLENYSKLQKGKAEHRRNQSLDELRNRFELTEDNRKENELTCFELRRTNNEIERYRDVIIIKNKLNSYGNLKFLKFRVPVYKTIFDKQSLRAEMDEWATEVKTIFKFRTPSFFLSLLNDKPVNYLCEIPLHCNILIVSLRIKPGFWDMYLQNNGFSLSEFSSTKMNYILHYVNTRDDKKDIKSFLSSYTKFNNIRNESDDVFSEFEKYQLWEMKPLLFVTSKKLKKKIKDTLEDMDNKAFMDMGINQYLLTDSSESHESISEFKDEGSIDLERLNYQKIIDDVFLKVAEMDKFCNNPNYKEDEIKAEHLKDVELKFYRNEDQCDLDEKKVIADEIDLLFERHHKHLNRRQMSHFEEIFSKNMEKEKQLWKGKKNFIVHNIKELTKKIDKNLVNIEKKYPSLFELNIPKYFTTILFSRKELHEFYSKYKALLYLNATMLGNNDYKVQKGIDIDTFQKGLSEAFSSAHSELIRRMFYSVGTSNTMKWKDYINILNAIRAKSLNAKLDLFFKLMDTDGNGILSWDEISELSKLSLKKLLPETDDDYLSDLSQTFTKFVFQALGMDLSVAKTAEISVDLLKDVIARNGEGVDLLLMMCCADKNEDIDKIEKNVFERGKEIESIVKDEKKAFMDTFLSQQKKNVPNFLTSDNKYVNKIVQRKSIFQNFNLQFEPMKNKEIEIKPVIQEKIEVLVNKRKRESVTYLDDKAVLSEAKLLSLTRK